MNKKIDSIMKRGDIVICSKPEVFNFRLPELIVGDKYEIITDPFIGDPFSESTNHFVFDVKNVETGRVHLWVESNHFITLQVLREFKLREILK